MRYFLFLFFVSTIIACSSTRGLDGKKKIKREVDESIEVQVLSDTIPLYGTLTLPKSDRTALPLAIIIAGSGPTDRDCNNPMGKSNTYKMIAEDLMANGIATLRYDKRMVGKSIDVNLKEEDTRFDHMVNDALSWIKKYENDKRFSSITILGHSEGSLVGMLAAQQSGVEKFVSLAGPARSADIILLEQIGKQMPFAVPNLRKQFAKLKKGELIEDVDPTLNSILRPSVQPYMISWFQYNPSEEIKKLSIPVLILQGTTDLQVEVKEAELLHEALPSSQLHIFEQSNHIFKDAPEDRNENFKTYTDPELPLSDGVVKTIVDFLR